MMRHVFALALLAAPAVAQEVPFTFSSATTERCLSDRGETPDCAGLSAEACMQSAEGGYTTVGMGYCLEREWQYWDARLNDAYRIALKGAAQADRDNAGFGPSQEQALREMQRAWIPYRDRTCDWVRSQWGGGTGGGPASLACLMRETARQTLFLRAVTEP